MSFIFGSRRWRRQPLGEQRINWNHPLAAGLVHASGMTQDGRRRNLVTGQAPSTVSGVTLGARIGARYGAISFDASTDVVSYSPIPCQVREVGTVFAYARLGTLGSIQHRLVAVSDGTYATTIALLGTGFAAPRYFEANQKSDNQSALRGSVSSIADGAEFSIGATFPGDGVGGDMLLQVVNGVADTPSIGALAPLSFNTTPGLFVGNRANSDRGWNGEISELLIWRARRLTADQLRELHLNPWQILSPINHRLYSFATPGAGQTIAVGQVTETDLAQAIAHLKTKALGQAAETDLAQALTAAKRLAIGQAAESSIAQPITAAKRGAVSQATETDTAQAIAHAKAKQLGQTTETDLAQTITVSGNKIIAVGQIAETDLAQAITRVKAKVLGQTTETDIAQAIARAKAKQLGQTTETDFAQAITPSIPNQVGQATEADLAQPLSVRKAKTLGQIAETDVAQAVTSAKTKGLGLALEIDLGQPITWAPKRRILGQATETDLAQTITPGLSSTQLPLGKRYTVGPRVGFIVGARNNFRVDQ